MESAAHNTVKRKEFSRELLSLLGSREFVIVPDRGDFRKAGLDHPLRSEGEWTNLFLYISSARDEFLNERQILHDEVIPYINRLCLALRVRVIAIDPNAGPEERGEDEQEREIDLEMDIRRRWVQKCHMHLFLVGDRSPPPEASLDPRDPRLEGLTYCHQELLVSQSTKEHTHRAAFIFYSSSKGEDPLETENRRLLEEAIWEDSEITMFQNLSKGKNLSAYRRVGAVFQRWAWDMISREFSILSHRSEMSMEEFRDRRIEAREYALKREASLLKPSMATVVMDVFQGRSRSLSSKTASSTVSSANEMFGTGTFATDEKLQSALRIDETMPVTVIAAADTLRSYAPARDALVVVLGEEGQGKSAALALAVERFCQAYPRALVMTHFPPGTRETLPITRDHSAWKPLPPDFSVKCVLRSLIAKCREYCLSAEENKEKGCPKGARSSTASSRRAAMATYDSSSVDCDNDIYSLREQFTMWLERAAAIASLQALQETSPEKGGGKDHAPHPFDVPPPSRVIVAIDDADLMFRDPAQQSNKLDDESRATMFSQWLPLRIPAGVTIALSCRSLTVDGPLHHYFRSVSSNPTFISLAPCSSNIKSELIAELVLKGLDIEADKRTTVVEALHPVICAHPLRDDGNGLHALACILSIALRVESFCYALHKRLCIAQEELDRLELEFPVTKASQVVAMTKSLVKNLPDEMEEVIDAALDSLEYAYGRKTCSEFFSLFASTPTALSADIVWALAEEECCRTNIISMIDLLGLLDADQAVLNRFATGFYEQTFFDAEYDSADVQLDAEMLSWPVRNFQCRIARDRVLRRYVLNEDDGLSVLTYGAAPLEYAAFLAEEAYRRADPENNGSFLTGDCWALATLPVLLLNAFSSAGGVNRGFGAGATAMSDSLIELTAALMLDLEFLKKRIRFHQFAQHLDDLEQTISAVCAVISESERQSVEALPHIRLLQILRSYLSFLKINSRTIQQQPELLPQLIINSSPYTTARRLGFQLFEEKGGRISVPRADVKNAIASLLSRVEKIFAPWVDLEPRKEGELSLPQGWAEFSSGSWGTSPSDGFVLRAKDGVTSCAIVPPRSVFFDNTCDIPAMVALVVIGTVSGDVHAYDHVQKEKIWSHRLHTDTVRAIAVDPSGKYLYTADDAGEFLCVAPLTGQVLGRIEAHDGGVTGLCCLTETVSASSKSVVTVGIDRFLKLWRVVNKSSSAGSMSESAVSLELDTSLEATHMPATAMDCSAGLGEGSVAVTGSHDGSITSWSLSKYRQLKQVAGAHKGSVRAVKFTDRADLVATAGDDGRVQLWFADTLTLATRHPVVEGAGAIQAISPFRLGLLVAFKSGIVHLLRRKQREYSFDGTFKADVNGTEAMAVHDETDTLVITSLAGKAARVFEGVDSALLCARQDGMKSERITLLDAAARAEAFSVAVPDMSHRACVTCVCISPASSHGSFCATGDADGEVRLWSIDHGHLLYTKSFHDSGVSKLVFTGDASQLFSISSKEQELKRWHVDSGELIASLTINSQGFRALAVNWDASRVLLSSDADITLLERDAEEDSYVKAGQASVPAVTALAIHRTDNLAVAGDESGIVSFSTLSPGQKLSSRSRCSSSTVSGSRVLSRAAETYSDARRQAGPTTSASLYEGQIAFEVLGNHDGSEVSCIRLSKDGYTAFSGAMAGFVKVWDLQKRTCCVTLSTAPLHRPSPVFDVCLHASTNMFFAVNGATEVSTWILRDDRADVVRKDTTLLSASLRKATVAAFSMDGRSITVCDEQGSILLYKLHGRAVGSKSLMDVFKVAKEEADVKVPDWAGAASRKKIEIVKPKRVPVLPTLQGKLGTSSRSTPSDW